ncbi:MAG TPA: GNAT family N-acetyltransferase [Gemmatimonadales bacterium]|nr:GNAT family N-acetyltransferase [Gemmatimonadales bacterium]
MFAERTRFLHYPIMKEIAGLPDVALRPFAREDFGRLMSWVQSEVALVEWCAGFFRHPLDDAQLDRYLESSKQPNARVIRVAESSSGDPVGHVEISQIWPYLSSRLSRVLVAPDHRRPGIGSAMIAKALSFSFSQHYVSRIDLGVSAGNSAAIACYEKLGFTHVGTWLGGIVAGAAKIDVYWMTVMRDQRSDSADSRGRP